MAHDLLFEIGCEEIPARFLPSILDQLEKKAQEGLATLRVRHGALRTVGTPRRLALLVDKVATAQEDLLEEVKGPPERAAFDSAGRPTKAAEGFARGQGVSVDSLEIRDTPQGRYVFALRREEGRATSDVIGGLLTALVTSLHFPKSMRWAGSTRFARPIRWLLALYEDEVIPVQCDGVTSSRHTQGHRVLGAGTVAIERPGQYAERLRESYVIVDPAERRALIWEQVQQLADGLGGHVEESPELLEEITYLVEYPTAFSGRFDPSYLSLPKEVLVTPMTEHQRYFPVLGPDGNLMPHFIAVRNGTDEHIDVVRRGNEKVLAARLADARFFFEEDRKQPLEALVPQLDDVVFQEALGTMGAKVRRIVTLSEQLAAHVQLADEEQQVTRRAAYLSKADLVTQMVYEFPELEGVMGREYARAAGEQEAVARAIFEHTLPRHAGDALPETLPGALVALADRFDTLVGCFAAGLVPSGSQDPYALRRAASGIVQIVLRHRLPLPLEMVLQTALENYEDLQINKGSVVDQVAAFIRQRLRGWLIEKGCRYDLVDAVLAVAGNHLVTASDRATLLNDLLQDPIWQEATRVFERVANLAQRAETAEVDEPSLRLSAEQRLHQAIGDASPRIAAAVGRGAWGEAVSVLAALGPAVDAFFDEVLVMDEDLAVRRNRLALLAQAAALFNQVADFSMLEG